MSDRRSIRPRSAVFSKEEDESFKPPSKRSKMDNGSKNNSKTKSNKNVNKTPKTKNPKLKRQQKKEKVIFLKDVFKTPSAESLVYITYRILRKIFDYTPFSF